MTNDAVADMLEKAMTGVLVSLRRSGEPVALPVWFVSLDGRIYVRTPARSKKATRVAADPRVSFLVHDGEAWATLRGVHLAGRARLVNDADLVDRISMMLDDKYGALRTTAAVRPDATNRHYASRVVIEIEPDSVVSWDNGLLRMRPAERE